MSKVNRILATRRFEASVKKLQKGHKHKTLQELQTVIYELANLQVTTQHKNHPLKNAQGHRDIHLEGGNLILVYRYDYSDDLDDGVLIIDLRLQDVVDHKELKNYNKKAYSAPVREYDPKQILSSTQFNAWYDSLPDEEQWEVDSLADDEGIPFYDEATDTDLSYLHDVYIAKKAK